MYYFTVITFTLFILVLLQSNCVMKKGNNSGVQSFLGKLFLKENSKNCIIRK